MTETWVYNFRLVFLKRKKKEMNKKREIGMRGLSKEGFFCHARLKPFGPVVEENLFAFFFRTDNLVGVFK